MTSVSGRVRSCVPASGLRSCVLSLSPLELIEPGEMARSCTTAGRQPPRQVWESAWESAGGGSRRTRCSLLNFGPHRCRCLRFSGLHPCRFPHWTAWTVVRTVVRAAARGGAAMLPRRRASRLSFWLATGAGGSAGHHVLGLARCGGWHGLARCGCGKRSGKHGSCSSPSAREQQRATRRRAAVPIAPPQGTWSWLQSACWRVEVVVKVFSSI